MTTIPHCDQRILHHPLDNCVYCNEHPEWQEARELWGIAFTGHAPVGDQIACPADRMRPAGSPSDHRRWGGNKPTSAEGDPSWPQETPASLMMYGDMGGRGTTAGVTKGLRGRLSRLWLRALSRL